MQIVGAICVLLILSSCSHVTGSHSSASGKPPACAYVTKLDQIANTVAGADVRNPDTFKKTLDTAVRNYVTNVRALRAVAPADLATGLERVEADVQQYRFDAALTDRAPLDAYAARSCGRVAQSAIPASSGSTTTTLGASLSTTTVGNGSTDTTAPSDG